MTSYKMLTSLPIRYAHRYLEGERKQNVFIVYLVCQKTVRHRNGGFIFKQTNVLLLF